MYGLKFVVFTYFCKLLRKNPLGASIKSYSFNNPFPFVFFPLFKKRLENKLNSHGNEFDLQGDKRTRKYYFHMKCCAPRLISKQK